MSRKPLSPLDYVAIQTKLPLHMHRHFVILAAKHGIDRMQVYMYALRFAFQSAVEFDHFLSAIQAERGKHGKPSRAASGDPRSA